MGRDQDPVTSPHGEVETSTIVITDMVESTALREQLGEVRADVLRRSHDDELGATARRYGGVVVKGTGDGLILAFRSASDGLLASVAMQMAVRRLRRRNHDQPPIRIGISAGDVTWEDGDCFGMPVVEAARLCSFSAPSQTTCASIVVQLARGRVHVPLSPLGDQHFKGVDGPLEVYEVDWARQNDSGPRVRLLPFVGRTREVDTIGSALSELTNGTGRIVLVAGEPGAGKSRLVSHATTEVPGVAVRVLTGRSHESGSIPYAPWAEIVEQWSSGRTAEQIDEVFGEGADLLQLLVGGTRKENALSDRTPIELGQALGTALRRIASETPLVLVFEDLHWADRGTLDLIGSVARITSDSPVAMIGTYRDTEVAPEHPLTATMAAVRRVTRVDRIALGPLGVEEVSEAFSLLGGRADTARELIDHVVSETGGNALFLSELLLDLRERGTLDDPTSYDPAYLPEALRDIVGSRVGALTGAARSVLVVAALFPRSFAIEMVSAAAGMEPGSVLDAVEEALEAGLVVDRAGGFEFTHDLIRKTLVASTSGPRLRHLHATIAQTLELAQTERTPGLLSDLIHHHRSAGNVGRERELVLEAGQRAESSYAFFDAIDFYRRAMNLAETEAEAAVGRPGLARSYAGAGYRLEAARLFLEAADAEEDHRLALTYRRDAGENLVRGGQADEGRQILVDTARSLGIGIPRGRRATLAAVVALQVRLGFTRWKASDDDRLSPRQREQLEFCARAYRGLRLVDPFVSSLITSKFALLALRSGDAHHRALAAVEQAVLQAVDGQNRPPAVDRLLERARDEARHVADPRIAAAVELVAGTVAFLAGDFEETLSRDEASDKLLHDLGGLEAAEQDVQAIQHNASLYLLGRIRDADAVLQNQIARAEARGDATALRLRLGQNGAIRLLATDDVEAVRTGIEHAVAGWQQSGFLLHHLEAMIARCELDIYQGRGEPAVERIRSAWKDIEATMLLRAQYSAFTVFDLLTRAHLAAGSSSEHRRGASEAIASLRGTGASWIDAVADLHESSLVAAGGSGDAAEAAKAAAGRLASHGLELHALSAAYRASEHRGDTADVDVVRRRIGELGVADPDRAVAMITPGWNP